MSRQIFIHDPQCDIVVTYEVEGLERDAGRNSADDAFTIRPVCPFMVDARILDKEKHIYRVFFTNANDETWHVDLVANNNGCKRINFDGGRVQLIVGCADFFPENNDPDFVEKARDRIIFIENLKAEKDKPEESNSFNKTDFVDNSKNNNEISETEKNQN